MKCITVLLIALLVMSVGTAMAGEHRQKGCYQEKPVGDVDKNFFLAYIGGDQNLVQLTKSIYLDGQVRYIPQQNGHDDNLFAGLVITNAKPLVSFVKEK